MDRPSKNTLNTVTDSKQPGSKREVNSIKSENEKGLDHIHSVMGKIDPQSIERMWEEQQLS